VARALTAPSARQVPASAALALIAAILVATGSCVRGDLRFLIGLPVTAAGLAVAARAVWAAGDDRAFRWPATVCALLWIMAFVGVLTPAHPGAWWYDAACRLFFVFGAFAIGAVYRGRTSTRRWIVGSIVVSYAALQIVTPLGIPDPRIDVLVWTQTCLQALRDGIHPYVVRLPTAAYSGPTAAVYPYMPATLLAFFPAFVVFGDCRVMSAILIPSAVVLNRASGRRLGVDPAFLDATTLAFVLHPRSTWITAMAWNESLLVFVVAAFAYLAIRRPAGRAQAIAFCLLPALKQYVAAPVLLFAAIRPPRQRLSYVTQAIVVAGLTALPFFVWNWRATMSGVVTQMVAPVEPRGDSTSLVALMSVEAGANASRWLSVVVQFGVAAIAYVYLRERGLGGLLLASGITLTATFLAGWQAFVNYYYFASMMLLTAAIPLAAGTDGGEGARRSMRSPSASVRATACGADSS
jgi:hypothetical protein